MGQVKLDHTEDSGLILTRIESLEVFNLTFQPHSFLEVQIKPG